MARASGYMLEGYAYHLTHRCHGREFLLDRVRERDVYRRWLREGVRRSGTPVLAYCITSNHVHVVVRADDTTAVSDLMHLSSGSTARQYNARMDRVGSMWEHPYQCTAIQDGAHLLNCICYAHLNMVRAGVVEHPEKWRWCSHDEICGDRKRYRILNLDRLQESLGMSSHHEVREAYLHVLNMRLESGRLQREAALTESLAFGDEDFVRGISQQYTRRRRLEFAEVSGDLGGAWMVREPPSP